ncbi:MAG: AraC family transcriptional regulator [Saprospiraceae bacterium]|nr:AraC family transcriptional regulator [Saprospiraceae bacterium]
MDISQQLLFFFSALGVFNGFLLAFFFLARWKKRGAPQLFFGLLLLMLSIRIGKSVFYYFLRDLPKIYLQIGLSACFFIGPFLWLYLRSSIHQQSKPTRTQKLHLALLGLTIISIGSAYPYATFPELWNKYIAQFIYAVWLAYLILATYALWPTLRKVLTTNVSLAHPEKTWLFVWGINLLIAFNYQAALHFKAKVYILGPLIFSFSFYGLGIYLLLNRNQGFAIGRTPNKYGNKRIQADEASPLAQRLQALMEQDQLYRNPKLKLPDLAAQLSISPHQLSQLLNDNLGKSFNTFVNEYRVEAACRQISELEHLSLEGIGFEVGFSSKSTFYATFKKMVGTTPAKYKANQQETAS